MPGRAGSRLLFVAAVALAAAATGDALVEGVSNTGVVGPGYSDTNHLSVIPTLVAGTLMALLVMGSRCIDLFRRASKHRDRLADIAADVCTGSPLRDLPWVLSLQFAALIAMESVEQVLLGGRLLGGLLWLGGPAWFSIVTHVALGAAFTVLAARFMRSTISRCARLVDDALELLLEAYGRQSLSGFAHRRDDREPSRAAPVHVYQIGERAPPLLVTLTQHNLTS